MISRRPADSFCIGYSRFPFCGWSALVACMVIWCPVLLAGDDELIEAERIIDRFIDVSGGKHRFEALRNRVVHTTVSVPAFDLQGTVTSVQAPPNKAIIITELGPQGTNERATNGEVAWERRSTAGLRLLDDQEKKAFIRSTLFNAELNWKQVYKSAKTLAMSDIEGKPAYLVEMTPIDGRPEIHYFDKGSGLRVKMTSTMVAQGGEIEVDTLYEDYREVDGLQLAFTRKQAYAGQNTTITVNKVEHNIPMPDDRFAIPDDVKALLEKEKQTPAADAPAKSDVPPKSDVPSKTDTPEK